MKNIFAAGALSICSVLALGSTSVYATTITLTPGDCDDFGGAIACDSGDQTGTSQILATIEASHPGLVELYKSDQSGTGSVDSGGYADDYDTVFSNTATDPADASITWTGPGVIFCGDCYVLIKDGNQDPSWYLFELASWDGQMTIDLTGFWPNQGAISHVSIMGRPAVIPVPAAVWLFGSGLLGLVGVARRRSA